MTANLENERVELFYFRLVGMASGGETEDYVPYGLRSPIFKGTWTQAKDEAERFRYLEDQCSCGVCIYTKRDNGWQKVATYLGCPEHS